MIEIRIQLDEMTHKELLNYAQKVKKPVDKVILDFVETRLHAPEYDEWSERLDSLLESMQKSARHAGIDQENIEQVVDNVVAAVRREKANAKKARKG